MYNLSVMISLYFFVRLSVQQHWQHSCGNDQSQSQFSWGQTRPYPGRLQAEGAIRIGLEYVPTYGFSSQSLIGASLKSGTAQVKGFLQTMLIVAQEQIKTSATTCTSDTPIPERVRNTFLNYDLYIFVNTVYSGLNYALGDACVLRPVAPSRSIFGRILWNKQQVGSSVASALGYQLNIRVTMHLFFHVIGFSSQLFQYWASTRITQTVGSVTYIVTSNVKAEVNAYFGCSSLGMPLQNQGVGFVGSHWQKDVLKDQVLVSSFNFEDYLFISRITIAALLDSGWYTSVKFDNAQSHYMQFGRGRGCSFLSSRDCSISPQFCTNNGVVFYQQAYGFCARNYFSNCLLQTAGSNTDCRNPNYRGLYGGLQTTLETPGFKSMAFAASVFALGNDPRAGFRCYESVCNPSGTAVKVKIGTKIYTCFSDRQVIKDSANFVGSLTCPADIAKFCASRLICQNSCGSQFMCLNRQCFGMQSYSCNSSQYFSSGVCVDCHSACAACSSELNCYSCNFGYVIKENKCYFQIP